jgi:hypothetical protein
MDLNQATQMLTWLDEERRQDKAELARLQEQVRSQAKEIAEQAKRIQELEGRLAGAQTHLSKIDRLDEFLQQFKDEIVLLLEKHDQQRQAVEKDATRLRQVEREGQSKALAGIRKELQKVSRHEAELKLRRAEDKRLGEAVLSIQQELADVTKASEDRTRAHLETQREQDTKRIAKLEEETSQLLTKSEAQARKLESLEDSVRRLDSQAVEWQAFQSELKQEQMHLMETQRLNEQQRQRQLENWTEELDEYRMKMEEYTTSMQRFTDLYNENKKALETLEKFEQRLKQTQSELMELQHLAEQRQKEHLEEWRMENEKRWRKEALSWEGQWREQARHDEELEALLKQVEKQTEWNRSKIVAFLQERAEKARQQIPELEKHMAQAEELIGKLP